MTSIGTIVVPLDGSQLAETALPYAAALARATGAGIVLLRVIEEMRPYYDERRREVVWIDPMNPRQELLSPELLGAAVQRLAGLGLQAQTIVRLGDPRKEILAEAEQHADPVIVLASHGRGGLGRVLLGSVATRVLQLSTCPVLVVRARETDEQPAHVDFARIAVPLDGSREAEQALPIARDLARATGATLHLVRVAETFRHELPDDPGSILRTPSYEAILERFDQLEAEAREYLEATASQLREQGFRVTVEVRSGDPWDELLDYTRTSQPDLMVMTTHGRGGVARWFFGSVADRLLTHAHVPLLMIRVQAPGRQ